VFLVMGLLFGVTGGVVFNLLYRFQSRHCSPTQLQAALTGISAASVFVVINAVQATVASGERSNGGSSDLVASAVVLTLGGVAYIVAGRLLKVATRRID
jgi:hypothetical protein